MRIERREEEIRDKFEAIQEEKRCQEQIEKLSVGIRFGAVATIAAVISAVLGYIPGGFFEVLSKLALLVQIVFLAIAVIKGGFFEVVKGWIWLFIVVVNFFPLFLIDLVVAAAITFFVAISFFDFSVIHFWVMRGIVKRELEEASAYLAFYEKEMSEINKSYVI